MNTSNTGPSPWTATAFRDAARTQDLPSAALKLALTRIPVFPCVPGSKNPLTAHGFQSATTNPQQIQRWWQRTPAANIGIPTGAPSRLVVVDVDVHRTGDGFKNFARLTEMGLVSRWAWMVRTPSGGMHAYFAANPGGEQRCWSMPSRHIDFRGDGGYVVAPPSVLTNDDGTTRPGPSRERAATTPVCGSRSATPVLSRFGPGSPVGKCWPCRSLAKASQYPTTEMPGWVRPSPAQRPSPRLRRNVRDHLCRHACRSQLRTVA